MVSRKYVVLFIWLTSIVIYMMNLFVSTPFSWILLFIPAVGFMIIRPKWSTAIFTAIVMLVVVFVTEMMLGNDLLSNEYGMFLLQSYMIGLLLFVTFTFVYIKQQEVIKRYKTLAYTDPLTNIYNRRYLDRFLKLNDYQYPLACIMIDIDHFKRVNDTYGHEVGDQVLNHLVQIVQQMIQETDQFIRIGGEEFLIIMTNHSAKEATAFAHEIRHKVEVTPFYNHKMFIPITISLGVASIQKQSNGFVRHVGEALSQAKKNGRNQVVNY